MLTLQPSLRRSPPKERKADSSILGVAWLNGGLSVFGHGAGEESQWTAPQPIPDAHDLGEALRAAVGEVGFTGRKVALLLAHPQLVQTFLEVPTASAAIVQRLVHRQLERQNLITGSVVWSAQSAIVGHQRNGQIVHVLPREIHDALVRSCREAGLHLTQLTPVSEAVRAATPTEDARGDELVMAIAAIPGALVLTVGQRGGLPLLCRTIPGNELDDTDRLKAEVRRTQLFVTQQYRQAVAEVWLIGPTKAQAGLRRVLPEGEPVNWISGDADPRFWAEFVWQRSAVFSVNLVSREQSEAPQRRAVSKWSRILGWIMLLLAGVMTLVVERWRGRELAELGRLAGEQQRLTSALSSLSKVVQAVQQRRLLVEAKEQSTRPPVHVWLTGYLATVLPSGLVITNLEWATETNGWRLSVRGDSGAAGLAQEEAQVEKLQSALAAGPLALTLNPPRGNQSGETKANAGGWAQRLQAIPAKVAERKHGFAIEGTWP